MSCHRDDAWGVTADEGVATMTMTGLESDVATAYRNFATREARGNSPLYEQVCQIIAGDDALVARVAQLPQAKRQPNLVLGAARYLGAPEASAEEFVAWMRSHWTQIVPVVMERMTQTNEVGRCATLLPFLSEAARRMGPLALVEVGCSAGLALYPDLYEYRYGTEDAVIHRVPGGGEGQAPSQPSEQARPVEPASNAPTLTCAVPDDRMARAVRDTALPHVAWRGGLDLNPLDVTSDSDVARDNARWLDALVWPGQDERAVRLADAITAVRTHVAGHPHDAPHIIAGDVVADLDRLLDAVPPERPLVVVHSAVLAYVDVPTRAAFEARMAARADRPAGFTWISNEAPRVMAGVAARLAHDHEVSDVKLAGRFLLAVDGEPRALTGPHGQALELL